MKAKKTVALFVLGALTMSLMAGCGSRGDTMVDPNAGNGYDDPSYTNPGYTDPGYGNTNPGYGNTNPGYGTTPGYGTGTPVQLIVSESTSEKTIFGNFKSVTFQVTNPSQQQVQGTLKVTFTNSSLFSKDKFAETQDVAISLPAGQSMSYRVTPNKTADKATAIAEVLQNGTGTGTGYGSGTGTGYGSGTGTGYGSGTGTGTGYGY